MSSTGTTMRRSSRLLLGGAATVTGRAPPRNDATTSAGPDGRGQADALRGRAAGLQRVQPLQGQGQVRAALAAGQRVHLVHDDRVHAAQHVPRLGGEQQEQ